MVGKSVVLTYRVHNYLLFVHRIFMDLDRQNYRVDVCTCSLKGTSLHILSLNFMLQLLRNCTI